MKPYLLYTIIINKNSDSKYKINHVYIFTRKYIKQTCTYYEIEHCNRNIISNKRSCTQTQYLSFSNLVYRSTDINCSGTE